MSPLLGSLVFALEMVAEIETQFQRDAEMFCLDLIEDRVCNDIQMEYAGLIEYQPLTRSGCGSEI